MAGKSSQRADFRPQNERHCPPTHSVSSLTALHPYPANRHPWLLSRHDCYSVVVFAGVKLGLDLLECVDRILHVLHGLGGGEHVAEDDHRAEDAVVPRAE